MVSPDAGQETCSHTRAAALRNVRNPSPGRPPDATSSGGSPVTRSPPPQELKLRRSPWRLFGWGIWTAPIGGAICRGAAASSSAPFAHAAPGRPARIASASAAHSASSRSYARHMVPRVGQRRLLGGPGQKLQDEPVAPCRGRRAHCATAQHTCARKPRRRRSCSTMAHQRGLLARIGLTPLSQQALAKRAP